MAPTMLWANNNKEQRRVVILTLLLVVLPFLVTIPYLFKEEICLNADGIGHISPRMFFINAIKDGDFSLWCKNLSFGTPSEAAIGVDYLPLLIFGFLPI